MLITRDDRRVRDGKRRRPVIQQWAGATAVASSRRPHGSLPARRAASAHGSRTWRSAADPPRPGRAARSGPGWSDSPLRRPVSTLSRTSPSASIRLISPYSAAVSAPPVRNQVAPGASHSSTSSNSARTRSLGDSTDLDLVNAGMFRHVHLPSRVGCSHPLSAVGSARASPRDHLPRGEPGDTCPRGRPRPRSPGRQCRRDRRLHVAPEPATYGPASRFAGRTSPWTHPGGPCQAERSAAAVGRGARLVQDPPTNLKPPTPNRLELNRQR